ncbi:DUF3606 domain-containing protein [Sinorhizobium numidicum]|uniref:DUF3606 domain-containing protein n=1 Tax=Sinorhizobium numidicum TaxID=680248 RepID=A0ABY8D048_9HYPH|nr:DUF3606 domain-containing protein [Sinorhizobium numidicum]WEX76856.1 DUF3606 domain-containing protein [Sinorhizobium numidicum]WEX83517.1 DUF3606 domain-containing protein [Sinorhizobium numidicum]
MADDLQKRGRDSERVSVQDHEIDYLMRTTNAPRQKVLEAIREVGPDRKKVLLYLLKDSSS